MSQEKTAVMYGAGNIGRGFIGQVFHDSGYRVVFIDVNRELIDALNSRNAYTQILVDNETSEERVIDNVCAVDARDREAAAQAIADCSVMAVSAGAAALPKIAPVLAAGLSLRNAPVNILVCENLMHGAEILRGYVASCLEQKDKLASAGFVAAVIGRMVPVVPEESRKRDPSAIWAERFSILPLDADAVAGDPPPLAGALYYSPFIFYEERKLYIHNMGHAVSAYLGHLRGYRYIWQAAEDAGVRSTAEAAMNAAAKALAQKYGEDRAALEEHVQDLLSRFGNRGLGDTVARVGADPLRKLKPGDRLAGALDLCAGQGIDGGAIRSGIAASLRFDLPAGPSQALLRERLAAEGPARFLQDYSGLSPADAEACAEIYRTGTFL